MNARSWNFCVSIFILLIVFLCASNLFAEAVFLHDGTIIEGKVVKETDRILTLKLSNKKIKKIKRRDILRVLFNEEYKKKVYIKRKGKKTIEAYIVEENRAQYTLREKLTSPAEYKISKNDVVSVSTEKDITKSGYYGRGVIPGLSQFYAGRNVEGGIFLSTFLASGALMGVAYWNFTVKRKAYRDLDRGSSQFDAKYDDYVLSRNLLIGSFALMGGIYLLHWIDVLFIAKPDFGKDKKKANKKKKGAYFNFIMDGGYAWLPESRYGLKVGFRF